MAHQDAPVTTSSCPESGEEVEKETGTVIGLPPPSNSAAGDKTPDASSEMTYLYLAFDSQVPAANTTIPSVSAPRNATPPGPPDLRPYANPLLWPAARKNTMLALSCTATFLTAYAAGSYSPPQNLMLADLGAPSDLAVLAGITTFCAGFALAPMVLAPFSEINGRYPVFVGSGIIFVIFQAVCGVVRSLAGMLVSRFFVGIGGSVFSTMVGGVLADMWEKEDRNTPMAIYSGAVLVGTGVGPLVAAVMTNRLGYGVGDAAPWKWIFWHQAIVSAILMVALALLLKESRGSVLLSRKARALNCWYEELEQAGYYGLWTEEAGADQAFSETTAMPGACPEAGEDVSDGEKKPLRPAASVSGARLQRVRWKVKDDEERSSIGKMISVSLYRPFHLLFTEPVVFSFSLWVSFAWAVLYLTFGSIPLVFSRQHGWNIEQSGYIFVSIIIGAVLATAVGIWQDHILHHPKWQPIVDSGGDSSADSIPDASTGLGRDRLWAFLRRHFPADAPEARLYFPCVTTTLLPIGLYLFGFTSRPDISWVVPAVAIVFATVGIYGVYLATFNYLADTYHRYASSALAAQSCCRNLLGGVFPLVTSLLFTNLGESAAGCLLGGIATALTLVPWALVFFGKRIRARSPFASELESAP